MDADSNNYVQEIEEQIHQLNELFYPRAHWSNPGPFRSEETLTLLTLMLIAKQRGFLHTHEEVIETHAFDLYYCARSRSDLEQWRVAAQRRGGDDLKDETWSALIYLRKRFPRARIEAYPGGLPYCYVIPRQGLVATAGNIDPRMMLEFMVKHRTPRLAIAGAQLIPAPQFGNGYRQGSGRHCLQWLEFSPPTFEALQEHYAAKERAFERFGSSLSARERQATSSTLESACELLSQLQGALGDKRE